MGWHQSICLIQNFMDVEGVGLFFKKQPCIFYQVCFQTNSRQHEILNFFHHILHLVFLLFHPPLFSQTNEFIASFDARVTKVSIKNCKYLQQGRGFKYILATATPFQLVFINVPCLPVIPRVPHLRTRLLNKL